MTEFLHIWNLYEVVASHLEGGRRTVETKNGVTIETVETNAYTHEGEAYPMVSTERYEHVLRGGMTDVSGRDYASVFKTLKDYRLKEGVHFKDGVLTRKFFEDYPGNLVFGYAIGGENEMNGAISRESPVRNFGLLGLFQKKGNTVFDEIRPEWDDKRMVRKELVSTVLSGSILIDVQRLSRVEGYERAFKSDEGIEPLDFSNEVKEHVANLIRGGMFDTRHFADSEDGVLPSVGLALTLIVVTDEPSHPFATPHNLVKYVTKDGKRTLSLNVEAINNHVVKRYGRENVIVAGGEFDHNDPLIDLRGAKDIGAVLLDRWDYPRIEDKLAEEVLKRL
ncbi:hypothetical protein [Thermococcus sp. JCM 11816]|uniref:hypothetical protein n=1 Tax=Thermococcus sp. (strain JCM 11816 / KS-1) TaxID=1295125 RepID=UPI0006CF8362